MNIYGKIKNIYIFKYILIIKIGYCQMLNLSRKSSKIAVKGIVKEHVSTAVSKNLEILF